MNELKLRKYDICAKGGIMKNNKVIKVEVLKCNENVSPSDKEMDRRATYAVKAAISKAKVCNRPIAKYDDVKKKAYLEYVDGRREYAD